MGLNALLLHVVIFIVIELPHLCVFDNDHVTCYIGVEVDASEHVDA